MHTVKWVSEQLGLAPATLRAWEQRYGIVRPTRSDGGYRLYDDADLETLKEMTDLIASGMQPAQAAERIRSGRTRPVRAATEPSGVPLGGLPAPGALIAAARSYDTRALEESLDAAFSAAGYEHVVDGWLMSAMVEVGMAWSTGDLDVAQEHFISAGVMRRLAGFFEAAGHARGGRHVLTGLPPGATHQIATLAFATMLRRSGLRVTYLGADLPVESWVQAVRTIRPDAVVLGAPRPDDLPATEEVILALGEASPLTPVHVGGPGAPPSNALGSASLSDTAARLADMLTGAPPTRRPAV